MASSHPALCDWQKKSKPTFLVFPSPPHLPTWQRHLVKLFCCFGHNDKKEMNCGEGSDYAAEATVPDRLGFLLLYASERTWQVLRKDSTPTRGEGRLQWHIPQVAAVCSSAPCHIPPRCKLTVHSALSSKERRGAPSATCQPWWMIPNISKLNYITCHWVGKPCMHLVFLWYFFLSIP